MQNSNYSECIFDNLDKSVTNVVKLLEYKNLTIATAESCTGGLLSELITSVPGASGVFELGLCTYSEKMKNKFLGVPMSLIEEYGVVSAEVASAMADGLKKCSGADVCISVTGIAGPSGGTEKTPVGTVFVGFDICGKHFAECAVISDKDRTARDTVRKAAAAFAFGVVEKILMEAVQ